MNDNEAIFMQDSSWDLMAFMGNQVGMKRGEMRYFCTVIKVQKDIILVRLRPEGIKEESQVIFVTWSSDVDVTTWEWCDLWCKAQTVFLVIIFENGGIVSKELENWQ